MSLPGAVSGLSLSVCGDGNLRATLREAGKFSSSQLAQGAFLASDPLAIGLRGYADLAALEAGREGWTLRVALVDGQLEGTLELAGETPQRVVLDRLDPTAVKVMPQTAIAKAVAHVQANPGMLNPAATGLCISEFAVAPGVVGAGSVRAWSIRIPRHDPADPNRAFRPASLTVEIGVTDGELHGPSGR